MFDKLEALEERFQLVSEKIRNPDIIADQESWRKYRFCAISGTELRMGGERKWK